jgi:hypothetical protein
MDAPRATGSDGIGLAVTLTMKTTNWFHSVVIACGVLSFVGIHDASAQLTHRISFTTSFPFVVDNTTLPAGSYTITPDEDDPYVLELRGAHASVIVVTKSASQDKPPSKSEVVFSRYDTGYVLKNIWVAGSNGGYVTDLALGERHLAKQGDSPREHRVAAEKQ